MKKKYYRFPEDWNEMIKDVQKDNPYRKKKNPVVR